MRKLNVAVTGLNVAYLVSQNIIARRVGHVALRLQATTSAEKFRGILDSGNGAVGEPHPVAA
jgi:hypothetical protein